MATKLRAVEPGEKLARKLTVSQAAEDGSLKEQLIATREQVARAMEDPKCHPRDLAPLSRRYIELAEKIETIAIRDAEESDGAGARTPDEDWAAV